MTTPLDSIYAIFDKFEKGSPEFTTAVVKLKEIAENGDLVAAEELAELLALPGIYHDPDSAYFWYHIVLSNQGYITKFSDQNPANSDYVGPIGDFRNESMVSILIPVLGFDRVKEIDLAAERWIKEKNT